MIETIYTDFTTKLLPKIAEGLTITKDYFMDLFGRYAHFLFIRDLTYTILCSLALIVLSIVLYKLIRKVISDGGSGDYSTGDYSTGNRSTGYRSTGDYSTGNRSTGYRSRGGAEMGLIFIVIPIGVLIKGCIQYGTYTIQDAYVPEIRIYQEIKGYISPTQH